MSNNTSGETNTNAEGEMPPQVSDQQITKDAPPSDHIATTKIPQAESEPIEELAPIGELLGDTPKAAKVGA